MKIEKDVFVAIIAGVIIGALTAFCFIFLPKHLPKKDFQNQEQPFEEETAPTYPLTIESPKEEELFFEEKVVVSGRANPNSLIAVVSSGSENVAQANGEGRFETEIALEEGINEIFITAYSQKNEEETVRVVVFYTEEEI